MTTKGNSSRSYDSSVDMEWKKKCCKTLQIRTLNKTLVINALLCAILLCCDTVAGEDRLSRRKRSDPRRHDVRHSLYLNEDASIDCFDAYANCRKIPGCKAALRGLNKRCKVVNGRCNAEMQDLPRCARIMDDLFEYAFPEKRCGCKHTMSRCFELLNKIYANPCFDEATLLRARTDAPKAESALASTKHAPSYDLPDVVDKTTSFVASDVTGEDLAISSGLTSVSGSVDEFDVDYDASIKHLKDQNMFPEAENAFDNAVGYITTRAPVKSLSLKNAKTEVEDYEYEENWISSFDDAVFGDEGFAEPPRRRLAEDETRQDNRVDLSPKLWGVPTAPTPSKSQRIIAVTSIEENEKSHVETTWSSEKITPVARAQNPVTFDQEILRRSNDSYKIIAIVLGTLLGVFIVLAVVFFAWTRSRSAFFYTSGKIVRKNEVTSGTKSAALQQNGNCGNQHKSKA